VTQIHVNMNEVLATLGYLPPALAGAMQGRFADFIDHHRRTVIKYAGLKFHAKRAGQRMVASRLFGYSAKVRNPTDIKDVEGQSFMAARPDVPQLVPQAIESFEHGKHVYSNRPMAIPFASAGTRARGGAVSVSGGSTRWNIALKDLTYIKGPNGRTLIIDDRDATVRRQRRMGSKDNMVVGVVGRRRYQPAMLGFGAGAAAIRDRHMARIAADAQLAMTAAGRIALQEAWSAQRDARDAFKTVYAFAKGGRGILSDKKYTNRRGELNVAKQARDEVLRQRLGGRGKA
jgi:hypothetical protein